MFSRSIVLSLQTLLLVGAVTATPVDLNIEKRDSKVIIGYRTVLESEAQKINNAGTLVKVEPKGTQLGSGIYLSNGLGDWAGAANGYWCVIQADKDKLEEANKVWVPVDQSQDWGDESAVDDYIKSLDDDFDPQHTLRMSKIQGESNDDIRQLLIPFSMLGTDLIFTHTKGELGLEAYCKLKSDVQSDSSLLPSVRIDYKDGPFEENVKGEDD